MDPTQWCHVIVACKNLEGAQCPNLVGCEQNCSLACHEPHMKAPWACRYWWLLERKCCYCNIAATSLGTSAAASAAAASLCIGKGRCWAVGGWELGGTHWRERKGGYTSSPNTTLLDCKACAQLRLEGATAAFLEDPARRSSIVPAEGLVHGFPCGAYPCLAQGQWRNSWPKKKSRGTTSRTWNRVRQDIILPTHSITTVRPVNQPPLNKGCLSYKDTTEVQTSAATLALKPFPKKKARKTQPSLTTMHWHLAN